MPATGTPELVSAKYALVVDVSAAHTRPVNRHGCGDRVESDICPVAVILSALAPTSRPALPCPLPALPCPAHSPVVRMHELVTVLQVRSLLQVRVGGVLEST